MNKISLTILSALFLICCSRNDDSDQEPYEDTDIIDESACDDYMPDGGNWPSDGGTIDTVFLGNGQEILSFEIVTDIVSFNDDSFVVVGSFEDDAIFGEGQPGETEFHINGQSPFIAKYDKDAILLWVKRLHAPWFTDFVRNWARSVVAYSDGSFAVRGEFVEEMTLALGEPTEIMLTAYEESTNFRGEFLARYDGAGNLIWAQNMIKGPSIPSDSDGLFALSKEIAILNDQSIVVVGNMLGDIVFGPEQERSVSLPENSRCSYLAKFDEDGVPLWAIGQGTKLIRNLEIETVCDGYIIVTGMYEGFQEFGNEPGNVVTFGEENVAGTGTFIARYYPNGELHSVFIYGKSFSPGGLTVFQDKSYVVAGSPGRDGDLTLFPETEDEQTLCPGYGGCLSPITKFGSDDRPGWIKYIKSVGGTEVHSVTGAPDGSVIITGTFGDEATFGDGEVNETTIIGYGIGEEPPYWDGFVARYFSDGSLAWARAINGVNSTFAFRDEDATKASAVLENSRKVVVGGRLTGNFAIDYGTESQWPEEEYVPPTGHADWYVAILGL